MASASRRATRRLDVPVQRPPGLAGGVIAAPASRPQPIATAFSATSASSPTRAGRNHWNASSPMPAISAASAGATIADASGRSRHTRRNSQAMRPNSTKWTRSTARIAGSALPVAAE